MQQKLQNTKNLINDVFDKASGKYDLMNNLMSFGVHKSWKKQLIYSMKPRSNKKLISYFGLFQFSVEKVYNVKYFKFRFIETSIIFSTVFIPFWWPYLRELNFFDPHLPLPSIIMATWFILLILSLFLFLLK